MGWDVIINCPRIYLTLLNPLINHHLTQAQSPIISPHNTQTAAANLIGLKPFVRPQA